MNKELNKINKAEEFNLFINYRLFSIMYIIMNVYVC